MIILGFSMFMVFQTIPILAESPPPAGFGDTIQALCDSATFLNNIANLWSNIRIYSIKTRLDPTCHNGICDKRLWILHARSISLATMDGICCPWAYFDRIIAWQCRINEYRASCDPYKNMVTSIGMTSLLRIVGSSVGPTVAGVLMQVRQITIPGHAGIFPSPESYTVVFLIAAIMSTISVIMALKIRQSLLRNQKDADNSVTATQHNFQVGSNHNASVETRDLD